MASESEEKGQKNDKMFKVRYGDRRKGDRRRCMMWVENDRRTGKDRRAGKDRRRSR